MGHGWTGLLVAGGALIIEGERKHEHKEEQEGRGRSEPHYGPFNRAILSRWTKTEEARAESRNGELRVTVPVEDARAERRQIPISSASVQTKDK